MLSSFSFPRQEVCVYRVISPVSLVTFFPPPWLRTGGSAFPFPLGASRRRPMVSLFRPSKVVHLSYGFPFTPMAVISVVCECGVCDPNPPPPCELCGVWSRGDGTGNQFRPSSQVSCT